MNQTLLILLIGVLAIYLVVRQFTEQEVNPRNLLLLPALSAYMDYIDLQSAFAHFAPALLVTGLFIGAVIGILTGLFRGKYMRVRLDSASGRVFYKPMLASSIMWIGLFIMRIAATALGYTSLGQNAIVGMIIASTGAIFLLSIVTQRFIVYTQSQKLQMNVQPQIFSQSNR